MVDAPNTLTIKVGDRIGLSVAPKTSAFCREAKHDSPS